MMVSGIDRTRKTTPTASKARQLQQRTASEKPVIAADNTLINVLAQQLAQMPEERRKAQLAELLVAEVLESKLGLSGVSEPEYARLAEAIKTILMSSADALTQLEQAVSLVYAHNDNSQ